MTLLVAKLVSLSRSVVGRSAQRGKWVGGVETKIRVNVGVVGWWCFGRRAAVKAVFVNGRRSAVGIATQCSGLADARVKSHGVD